MPKTYSSATSTRQYTPGQRATLLAAVIMALATLVVGGFGLIKTATSGQPWTITNILNNGVQIFGNVSVGGTPSSDSGAVKRTVPFRESTTFDGDVTVSAVEYLPHLGAVLMLNGTKGQWTHPGARLDAKQEGGRTCFVHFVSVTPPPKPDEKDKAKFTFEYICKSK